MLPTEYQKVEYIESTGKQCIETNYVVNENDVLVLRYEVTRAVNNGDNFLFSSRRLDGDTNGLLCSSYGTQQRWYARFGHSSSKQAESTEYQLSGVLQLSKGSFVVNGTQVLALAYSAMPVGTLTLFGQFKADGRFVGGNLKCFSFMIARNGTVIRDFIPCYRKSDGEAGVYDIVTNTFHTNAWSGEFLVGPDVKPESDLTKLVTDRTQQDVDYARQLVNKLVAGTATEAEIAEWNSFTLRGVYNHTDLNRVAAAMEDLKLRLEGYGYAVPGYQRIKVPHVLPEPEPTSRLPEGYTELAYIESTGTQYIDTGFKPNNNTRVVMDVQATATGTYVYWGARTGTLSKTFCCFAFATSVRSDYGTTQKNISTSQTTSRVIVEQNKNVCTHGGLSVSHDAQVFQCDFPLYLLAANSNGTVEYASMPAKLYSCQIYDNGTLVRDYIPCVNSSGIVGLYDLVTAAFFGNSGTGEFYGFVQPVLTANGTIGGSSFAVYASNEHSATYAAYRAFSSDASAAYSSSVNPSVTPVDYVIYNPDSICVKSVVITNVPSGLTSSSPKNVVLYGSNNNSTWDLLAAVTNTNNTNSGTWEIVSTSNEMYRYFKLHITSANTSEAYVNIGKIQIRAYVVVETTNTHAHEDVVEYDPYTWYEFDWPTPETMTIYLLNVSAIRAVIDMLPTTPKTPADMGLLTWAEANDIEQILFDVETVIYRVVNGFPRSDAFTFWSGHRPLPSAISDIGRTWEELDVMQTTWGNWQVANWYLLLYGNLRAEGVID